MDYDKLIEQYRQAADEWEKRHPVTDTFDLRVQDALRDAATAIETLCADLACVTAERDGAVLDLKSEVIGTTRACDYCKKRDPENYQCEHNSWFRCCDWEWFGIQKED